MKHSQFHRRAFSMAELLTVMAILIILASLFLPSVSTVKRAAITTVCTSNLRQIHTALKLYEIDYEEYPPNSFVWPAFKTYYPVVLECPLAEVDEMLPEFDYSLFASASGNSVQLLNDCRSKRESMIPLAWDKNHSNKRIKTGGYGYFIILRENGSIDKVWNDQLLQKLQNLGNLTCPLPLPVELNL